MTRLPIASAVQVFVCIFASLYLAVSTRAQTEIPETSLPSGITTSARLNPVSPNMRRGKALNAPALIKMTPNNVWYTIPSWLAGEWKQETATVFYTHDFKTKNENFNTTSSSYLMMSSHGTQQDKSGKIWDCAGWSGYNVAHSGIKTMYFVIDSVEPVEISDDKVVLKLLGSRIATSANGLKIDTVTQLEVFHTYTKVGQGVLKCVSLITKYDETGDVLAEAKLVSMETRVQKFKPINQAWGRNYKSLFDEYLSFHNLK